MKKVRLSKLDMVELSLSTSRMVERAARGPLKMARMAAWGK